ncbi:MAG: DNA translocase FtsK [Bryobacterales bacterium]|nr:DNA translocase FtsK [Bryobacteraceae bacterium]MDW8130530.1 DNA translocase FtsK [Bryobacterales bacterium]
MRDAESSGGSRWSELGGFLLLLVGLAAWLSLVSYHPGDPSWNTATGEPARNLIGPFGAHLADLALQGFGAMAFPMPVLLVMAAWNLVRRRRPVMAGSQLGGFLLLVLACCAALGLAGSWQVAGLPAGGLIGLVLAESLRAWFNTTGAALVLAACLLSSLYLLFGFSLACLAPAARRASGWWPRLRLPARLRSRRPTTPQPAGAGPAGNEQPPHEIEEPPPGEPESVALPAPSAREIPIRTLEDLPEPEAEPLLGPAAEPMPASEPAAVSGEQSPAGESHPLGPRPSRPLYRLPPLELLNEGPGRGTYDGQELQEIAARIEAKFKEFGVLGSVVQINPGPVVTTFEFKPEAGIKYSRIVTLTEDLCLGLQAESILIERIPGRPTVGIEVPNARRELIVLRQVLESEEFQRSPSRLTLPLGKDVAGRIKVTPLEAMPHLLIAGSTGSGKSVLLNCLIMSVLYKATPDEVRMILVDPKRLELGLYEGIPHLLTPVITDARKAANALRNAVLEMERRFRVLSDHGVRNIEQYHRKFTQLEQQGGALFGEEEGPEPLPYVLIVIDELADLMIVEGRNVEESVMRLAQMARAVGMHLVLATQRPSVDVITGVIKANFPARISFRVATRVDSRTILDVMGAEHLLGRGDMLFLPPASSRLTRLHGPLVTEAEINRVVEFWKAQASPEYDPSYLIAPPSEEETAEGAGAEIEEDPLYRDAVRIVCELGKASTSTLQRRLRLGYGRAARILDRMQREGIIGPPDGAKPRPVLRRPEWLDEPPRPQP